MPTTGAERQRLYRARRDADPEKRAKYLERTRERWRREREMGKRKSISEVSESERNLKRQQWRNAQARRRAAQKSALSAELSIMAPGIFTAKSEEEPISITPRSFKYIQQTSTLKFTPAATQCKGTQTPDNICAEIEMIFNNRGIPRKRPRWESMEEWAPIDNDISQQSKENTSVPPHSALTSEVPVDIEFSVEESPACHNTKYIVYESCLRQLFHSCPVCSMPCEVKGRSRGTFVSFDQHCPHCNYSRNWKSQPVIGSTPFGNLQMSAAIYFTGLSFPQVEKFCKALQLQSFNYDTFRKHARNYLEPAIVHKWNGDQQQILDQLLEVGGKIKVGGDMWTDSGRAAEYGCYSLTHQESNTIVDLQLEQSNEKGKDHMKTEALKRCLDRINVHGLEVDSIITENCPKIHEILSKQNIAYFYDIQVFAKRLSKRLEKLSRRKDCAVLKKWLSIIKNHLYWSVTSSTSGAEKVAKWTSLINHMQNIHQHQNALYPTCTHPDVTLKDSQKWLEQGSNALNQVDKILNDKHVLENIAKLCPNIQAYSMNTFHNLIQEFTQKHVIYPPTGMLCRLYLAAMHHNENALCSDLEHSRTNQEASSKEEVKIETTYNYLDELLNLTFEVLRDPAPFMEEMKKTVH